MKYEIIVQTRNRVLDNILKSFERIIYQTNPMQAVQYLQVTVFLKTFTDYFYLIYKSTKSQILGRWRVILSVPLNTDLT